MCMSLDGLKDSERVCKDLEDGPNSGQSSAAQNPETVVKFMNW